MRVLIVSQYFWPENFPVNALTFDLVDKGHEVTVLTGIPNYPSGSFFPGYGIFKNLRQCHQGVKIIRVPLVPRGKGGKICLLFNYLSFAFIATIMAPFSCRGKYDLIFVCGFSPITAALPAIVLKKIKPAPVLFWVQDLWPESLSASGAVKSKLFLKLINKLVYFIYHRCSLILVQSKAFIPSILNFGIDRNRIVYFPNSAGSLYRPAGLESDAIERREIPQGFIVMFAGNVGAAQDFPTIIDAAERLKDHPDIHWVIIGDGRRRQWAEDEVAARNLGRNLIFLGRRPSEQMPRYFALADVLLVSLKNEEIFKLTIPSKVQSYLACGKPVIASLAGEGARIIEEAKAGFLSFPEDPCRLAEMVLKMYHLDEGKRQAMGINGRQYFENNFCQSKLMEELDNLFKGIGRTKF